MSSREEGSSTDEKQPVDIDVYSSMLKALATLDEAELISLEECELFVPSKADLTRVRSTVPPSVASRVMYRFESVGGNKSDQRNNEDSSIFSQIVQ